MDFLEAVSCGQSLGLRVLIFHLHFIIDNGFPSTNTYAVSIRNAETVFYIAGTLWHKKGLTMALLQHIISRNRPYIHGHLAFYFKLNSKLSHKILKIDLNVCCYFHCNRVKQCYAKIKARI